MSSRIWYVGEYSIAAGKAEEFKSIVQAVIDQEHSAADVLVTSFFWTMKITNSMQSSRSRTQTVSSNIWKDVAKPSRS